MNILLFGKGGQVGWELQRSLAVLGQRHGAGPRQHRPLRRLCQPRRHRRHRARPQARRHRQRRRHTAVDKAESEPDWPACSTPPPRRAGPREAAALGAWLVHYSTDYVFDGSGTALGRDRHPAPLSVYGRTKLEGEQLIQQSGAKHLILRTSWVYAARGGNFAKTMLRLAQERERLTVIDDQWGAPPVPSCWPT